jgi:NADH-quinone oxidoreductase subunit M
MPHHLLFLVAAPIAGAGILAVLPRARSGVVRAVTAAAAALAVALAVPLWLQFTPRGAQWQFVDRPDWAGWQPAVAIDGFALVLVLLTVVLSLAAALLLAREPDERARAWGIALLLVEAGALGAFVSLDARQVFVFWQLAVAAVVAMTALAGPKRMVFGVAGVAVVAAVAMYSGLLALGDHYRELASVASFDVRQFQTMPVPKPVQMQVFSMLVLGCLAPPGIVALYAWRSTAANDDGHESAFVSSTILGAVAVFGFWRLLLPVVPFATRTFATAMMVAGGVFAVIAVIAAVTSRARIAVYWIGLAQAALAIVGLFAATPNALAGAALQLVAASLAVAALVPIIQPASATSASRLNAVVVLIAMVAAAAGFSGGRLLASGLAPFGRAMYGIVLVNLASALVLAATGWRRSSGFTTAGSPRILDLAIAALPIALLLGMTIHAAPLEARLETSVARVIVRVSPEYASQVSDCLNQPAPPPPSDSGLPSGMVLAAPCTDASSTADPAVKR